MPEVNEEVLKIVEGKAPTRKKNGKISDELWHILVLIKAGTYVLECDVHFPTDVNLLWDAGFKTRSRSLEREFLKSCAKE